MKHDIKQKWIEALTSGEYQQGHNHLQVGGGFCCLGVLCDLHSKETGVQWMVEEHSRMTYFGMRSFMPSEVSDWAGIDQNYDKVRDTISDLMQMNDASQPFTVIAKQIRDRL